MKILLSTLLALAVLATATPSLALDFYGVDLKLGLRGGTNVGFLPAPVDVGDDDNINPQALFYGVGWNLGAAVQVRAFDVVGLELGYLRGHDSARAAIELEGVSDCTRGPRCRVQKVGARFSHSSHHLPLVLHFALPFGTARPFITTGVDFVLGRGNRTFETFEIDPFPESLDPATQADLMTRWGNSVEAQYLRGASLNEDHPERIGAIIAGLGLNISASDFEVPIEFRLNIYPKTGDELYERGVFAPDGVDTYQDSVALRYNDTFNYQLFVLVGFDYVIF